MRCSSLSIVVFAFSLLAESAPYTPQYAELRKNRKQAAGYSIQYNVQDDGLHRLQKRAVPYSVVQVDGGSTSATLPPVTMTVMETLTLAPTTETFVYTTAITQAALASTIAVMRTQEIFETITVVALHVPSTSIPATTEFIVQTIMQTITVPRITETLVYTSVVTEEQLQQTTLVTTTHEILETITVIPSKSSQITSAMSLVLTYAAELSVQTAQGTITIFETVAASPTALTSTVYYDDGLWHTHYPVRGTTRNLSNGISPTTFAGSVF